MNEPFLQVALNGNRSRAEHPAVPVTPAEMAADITQLYALGVRSVHLHARDAAGRESLRPDDVAATLNAIRAACPDMELALSTAEGIAATPQERLVCLRAWTVWPDTLCVNLAEEGIQDVLALAQERGQALEAGLFWPENVRQFRALGHLNWRRALLEPQAPNPAEAETQLEALLDALGTPQPGLPHVIHGMDATTYPLLRRAAQLTQASRIGFEDVLTLPDGTPARDNAQLYRAALLLMKENP